MFDEALDTYKKTNFEDNISQASKYANIGNTYVKQAKERALENAIEAYENSLKYNEDKEVRENLEAVKKELEKQMNHLIKILLHQMFMWKFVLVNLKSPCNIFIN